MKWWFVAKREFLENVKKKSFIITTLAAPVLMAVIYGIPILFLYVEPGTQLNIALLDHTGRVAAEFIPAVDDTLKDGRPKYLIEDVSPKDGDFDAAKGKLIEQIRNDKLDVLIEVTDEDLESGRIGYISKDEFSEMTMDYLRDKLDPVVITLRLANTGLDYEQVTALTRRVRFNDQKVTRSGVMHERALMGELIVVMFFVMILYVTLISWGMSIQRSVIEEKSSRVIEVMLSSLEPRDLFIGKLIGIGAVGLVQIVVWAVMALAIGSSAVLVAAKAADFITVSASDIIYFLVFYLLGYMLYSAFFTIIGAICNTEQEAQQLQVLVIIPLVIPLMLVFVILNSPNTPMAIVLSLIPIFAPLIMMARVVVAEPAWWEIALAIVLLLLASWGVIVFSARIFRVGILMYGKRPSLREVLRWFRYA